jgi:hypothetical protein
MPKSTSPINPLAVFTTVLCADVSTPNLQPQNFEVKNIVFVHGVWGARFGLEGAPETRSPTRGSICDATAWTVPAPDTCACTLRRIVPRLRWFAPQKPSRNDTPLRIARLVAPTHPVS